MSYDKKFSNRVLPLTTNTIENSKTAAVLATSLKTFINIRKQQEQHSRSQVIASLFCKSYWRSCGCFQAGRPGEGSVPWSWGGKEWQGGDHRRCSPHCEATSERGTPSAPEEQRPTGTYNLYNNLYVQVVRCSAHRLTVSDWIFVYSWPIFR